METCSLVRPRGRRCTAGAAAPAKSPLAATTPATLMEARNCLRLVLMLILCVLLFPRITYSPYRIRPIVSYQQRAVRSHRHPDRTTPNSPIGKHEAGEKVLVFAACLSRLMQGHADDFVSHAHAPVPRAPLRREDSALIFRGKLLTLVERHFE